MNKLDARSKKILKKYAFGDYLNSNSGQDNNTWHGTPSETNAAMGAIPGPWQIAARMGESLIQNQESNMKDFDIKTGEFKNEKSARNADLLRGSFDPGTTLARTLKDKNSTFKDKFSAASNFIAPLSGFNYFGMKNRLKNERNQNIETSENYNTIINKQKLANLQANFANNQEQRNIIGANRFKEGGELTRPINSTDDKRVEPKVPTLPSELTPNDKLVFPYDRAKQMYQAHLFGTSEQPFIPYKYAVERGLTPTTQEFIYNRHNTKDPYAASIAETQKMGGKAFFDVNNGQIEQLMPTQDIPLDRAQRANKFMSDLYNRGYIKYCRGGKLANGGLLEYGGSTHEESPYGGVEVDSNGNPTQITNNQPSGLVEKNETSWINPKTGQTYIFSNRLSYK